MAKPMTITAVERRIHLVRGRKVILDRYLAEPRRVLTGSLSNRALTYSGLPANLVWLK